MRIGYPWGADKLGNVGLSFKVKPEATGIGQMAYALPGRHESLSALLPAIEEDGQGPFQIRLQ